MGPSPSSAQNIAGINSFRARQCRVGSSGRKRGAEEKYLMWRKQGEVVLKILEVGQKGVGAHGVDVGARHALDQLPCTREQDRGGEGQWGKTGKGEKEKA